jgi:transcriptional regulator with XRE-family HTH domain
MKAKNGELNPDPVKVKKILGKNIRNARHAAELSQMRLAAEAHIDSTTLYRTEAGNNDMTISSIARLREVLGVSWDKLLKGI